MRIQAIAQVTRHNEHHRRGDAEIDAGLLKIWRAMLDCVARGCRIDGVQPDGFKVNRRAAALHRALSAQPPSVSAAPLQLQDWVNLFARAVNEENAVISGPEVGCQGAVAVDCSLVASTLCTVQGDTPQLL